jgi:hypothetical protein
MPCFAKPEKRAAGGVAICPSRVWLLDKGIDDLYRNSIGLGLLV